jgi:mono/diheme cytochrome c family protein
MVTLKAKTRRTGATRSAIFAGLLACVVFSQFEAFAEDEDRPIIKVPRIGGRELFQNCVLCHKYDGRGGPSEGGYAADLRVTKLTRDEVVGVITNGRPAKGMPPFNGLLDADKIDTLATFIKEDLKLKE